MSPTSETGPCISGIVIFMPHVTAGTPSNHHLRVGPRTDVKSLTLPSPKLLTGFLASHLVYHTN